MVAVTSGLGSCEKCHGPLCVSGRMVACERCGHQVPDHPVLSEPGEGVAKLPTKPAEVKPMDYASSVPDRVRTLEQLVAEQGKQIEVHGKAIASLRETLAKAAKNR